MDVDVYGDVGWDSRETSLNNAPTKSEVFGYWARLEEWIHSWLGSEALTIFTLNIGSQLAIYMESICGCQHQR